MDTQSSELYFGNDIILVSRLQHPQLPCLNVGRATKVIWMPLELCHIAKGQRRLKLNPDEQVS